MKPKQPDLKFILAHPARFYAFGLGSGLSPVAPGTVGTLAAMPMAILFAQVSIYAQMLIVIAAFILGIWFCQKASNDLKIHDHGGIVWDEFVGLWLTFCFIPTSQMLDWEYLVAAFVCFRFFDILKPWPIIWFDKRLHGGFGIMVDDLIAGLFAGFSILFINWFVL